MNLSKEVAVVIRFQICIFDILNTAEYLPSLRLALL